MKKKIFLCHGYRYYRFIRYVTELFVQFLCGYLFEEETGNHNFSYFIFMFLADRDEYGPNNVNNNELDGIFIFILLISRRLY